MNPALLHRRNGRSIFWIAFMIALAVHLSAVALAKTKSPTRKLEDFSPSTDVIVDIAEPVSALPEESAESICSSRGRGRRTAKPK
jgi:hypothetical protein